MRVPGLAALLLVACTACAAFEGNRPLADAGPAQTTRHTITAGGLARSFYQHLPKGFSAARRYPLLVLLHGHGNNGATILHQTKMEAVSDKYHFILASPNGTGRFGRLGLSWNAGTCCGRAQEKHVDDVSFLATLIDTLAAVLPVDRGRVTIAGFSAGGMLALRVACDRSDVAAVYVNVQGTMPDTTCRPSRPVSMLLFSGDDDEDMQSEHAENKRHNGRAFSTSALGTLRFWARHNGCDSTFAVEKAPGHTDYRATGCALGTETELVSIADHPHAWPGGHRSWLFAPKPSRNVDASLTIADFMTAVAPSSTPVSHREPDEP